MEVLRKNLKTLKQKFLKKNKIIIDPYKTEYKEKGNIILITHDHFDHLSLEDLKKVTNTSSIVIAPTHCKKQLEKLKIKKIIELNSGKNIEISSHQTVFKRIILTGFWLMPWLQNMEKKEIIEMYAYLSSLIEKDMALSG